MENRNEKRLPMLAANSSQNYAKRLNERMTPDEAMAGVIRMLSAYSEFSPCTREYMMTLTETLCQFPLEVATAACSPVHGVPKVYKNFRPNAGQVNEWCTNEAGWLYRMAERYGLGEADSHKAYTGIKHLETHYTTPRAERPSLDDMLKRAAQRMGREVRDGHLTLDSASQAAEDEAKAKRAALIDRANEKTQATWDSCASVSEGIKISPSLRKLLAGHPAASDLEPVPF